MRLAFTALLLLAFVACRSTPPGEEETMAENDLLRYFPRQQFSDTIDWYAEWPDPPVGDSIPPADFFAAVNLPDSLRALIDPETDLMINGRGRWPLTDQYELCLVDIRQNWWGFSFLLLYDKPAQVFRATELVAALYGGEGGQIVVESRCFDTNADGFHDILSRHIERNLDVSGEEPVEVIHRALDLRLWTDGSYIRSSVGDTARWAGVFANGWQW